ncbi:MAG: putative ABC transporter permease subunit [Clostridia bacterium]
MNNKIFSLTKAFLKNSYQNNFGFSRQGKQRKTRAKIGGILLAIILIVYIASIFGFISFGMIQSFMSIHQETLFIGIFFLAIAFLVIFQTIFTSVNVFYFSKDVEHVLPFPIKPWELLVAKFNTIIITEYMIECLFGLVPILLYGILTGAGFLFYLFAIFVLLLFPILPGLIVCFIMMIIMSFSKLFRDKDKFQLVSSFIIIAVVVGIQLFFINGQQQGMSEEEMLASLMQANSMVSTISSYFPTIEPSVEALTSTTFLAAFWGLLKLFTITVVSYVIFIFLGQKLYLRGAIGSLSGGTKTKRKLNIDKAFQSHSISYSYIMKEFKMLFRNPIFFMQCILPAILLPVIFGVCFVAGLGSDANGSISSLTQEVTPFIHSPITLCVCMGIIQFFMLFSYITVTAFSRDGSYAVFSKYIPVPLYKQIWYKVAPAFLLNNISILFVLITMKVLFSASFIFLVILWVIANILNLINCYLGILVDLKRPKLEWDTEYAVVKQNMNMFYTIAFGMLAILLFVILGFGFTFVSLPIAILITLLILGGIAFALDRYIHGSVSYLFDKII